MELHDLLGKLDGVKAHGGYHIARCPCPAHSHGDREPSLSIREEDGRLHLRCFVSGGDDEVLTALGITWKDLVPEEKGRATDDLVTEYRYEDELGHLLYVVERHVGKRFTQRAADGSRSLKGVRRVLYRLPQVRLAIRDRRYVFLVEGEKDVHTLEKLGCVATTNSGGAEGWRPEYGDQLSGAKVIILYDNDEAGFKRATKLQEELRTRTRSLKVVDLPGLADKGDVTDWVQAGGTKEQLVALVKGTTEAMNARTMMRKAIDVPLTPVSWLWYPWIPRGEMTIIGGLPGVGKSYVSLAIAATLSRGGMFPLADYPVEPGATFHIAYEDRDSVLRQRFEAMGGDLERLYLPDLPDPLLPGAQREFTIRDIEPLAAELAGRPEIRLVTIDPIMEMFVDSGVNPRWEEEARRLFRPLSAIAEARDIAILLITHPNKSDGPAIQRLVGAGSFAGRPRSAVLCGPHPDEPGVKVMQHLKANLANEADPLAYRLTADGLIWLDDHPLLAPGAVLGNAAKPKMPKVDEWLLGFLDGGAEHTAKEIEDGARKAGFTYTQVKKAKVRLNGMVCSRRLGFGEGGEWVVWRMQ